MPACMGMSLHERQRACTRSCGVHARRNFMARKEGCSNTWVNHFYIYVRDYGGAASQTASNLNPADCATVPDVVL